MDKPNQTVEGRGEGYSVGLQSATSLLDAVKYSCSVAIFHGFRTLTTLEDAIEKPNIRPIRTRDHVSV